MYRGGVLLTFVGSGFSSVYTPTLVLKATINDSTLPPQNYSTTYNYNKVSKLLQISSAFQWHLFSCIIMKHHHQCALNAIASSNHL